MICDFECSIGRALKFYAYTLKSCGNSLLNISKKHFTRHRSRYNFTLNRNRCIHDFYTRL